MGIGNGVVHAMTAAQAKKTALGFMNSHCPCCLHSKVCDRFMSETHWIKTYTKTEGDHMAQRICGKFRHLCSVDRRAWEPWPR